MASIFKRSDAKHWFAAYRSADGRRVKATTKVEDKDEAKRIADRWELQAREERDKRKTGNSLDGVSDAMQRATQLAVAGRLDAATARDLINDLLAAAGQQRVAAMTNRKWCDDWRAGKRGTVKESSRLKYDQLCREWLTFLNSRADLNLELITKTEVVAFRDRLDAAGLSARTVNHTIKILRGIYSDAVEQGHIGRNPFVKMPGLRADSDEAKRQPFTNADVAALIRAARDDWKGLIILSATTGLRLMDAARLRWRDLDIDKKVLRTKTAKTGAALKLPIHPAFVTWLRKQPRGIAAAPIFVSLADKAGAGKSGLSMAFKRIMERAGVSAGIARKAQATGRGRTTSQKSFHSLRHFAATQLAAAGIRAEVARQITGHTDAGTHGDYINADLSALRDAVKTIRLSA